MPRSVGVLTSLAVLSAGVSGGGDDYLVEVFGGDAEFLWGAAAAAAQTEGAWNVSGKQPSIWDDFCHSIAHRDTTLAAGENFSKTCGKVPRGQSGTKWTTLEVADDFYHTYAADLDLLSGTYGMNAMRVSISWPRVMPLNKETGEHEPNSEGIEWYRAVFRAMKDRGVTPFVTLFHWDLPNDLSWLEGDVVEAFRKYATLAFESFPEVEHWATFNEPNSVCAAGYAAGVFAPGHKNTTGHLTCGHHILLAHAAAARTFRRMRGSGRLGGGSQIGIVLDYKWAYPLTDSEGDRRAAEYDEDNIVGFWADPIFRTGDYPQSLKDFFGDRMPKLTRDEQRSLKGSADFFGVNTYGGKVARWNGKALGDFEPGDDVPERFTFSPCKPGEDNSTLVDPAFECGSASGWLWAKPEAMRRYLNHVHKFYGVDTLYVTEFGVDVKGESDMALADALNDTYRQEYYQRYMEQIALAKKEDGVPVRGVFAWSLMDNFEWEWGYHERFGTSWSEFDFGEDAFAPPGPALKPRAGRQWRQRKDSSCWLEEVWTHGKVVAPDAVKCATPEAFAGTYMNSSSDCEQSIVVSGANQATISGADPGGGAKCGGGTDSKWEGVPAMVSGQTIVANFTGRNSGPEQFVGYLNRKTNEIEWQDGSKWVAGKK
mmetsp:Transcript_74231/g.209653  ORF Transcript_74231/g.209653 Transcript_74231/m.209653 type:complete len:653 (-) Transcript_74231:155-2113(-)